MSVRRRQVISLTPLIDVVFILLVFFMLASSFQTWRSLPVDMASGGSGGIADGKTVMVEARVDGFRFGGRPVNREDLMTQLVEKSSAIDDMTVILRFDADLPLQDTVDLLDDLRGAGITEVRILPPRGGEPS
jgi:biopolymer transport protein ExbD